MGWSDADREYQERIAAQAKEREAAQARQIAAHIREIREAQAKQQSIQAFLAAIAPSQ